MSPDVLPILSHRAFFRVWLQIGAQSFGGGAASMALIHRAAVVEYGWLTEAEFVRDWALVQLAPGVNLLGFIILIGRRWGGASGIALALGGLLLPSAAVTVLMAAVYAHIAGNPIVAAALRGILPATVGLGLATTYNLLAPSVRQSRAEGHGSVAVCLALAVVAAVMTLHWSRLPILIVLLGSGAVFALFRGATFRDETGGDPGAPPSAADTTGADLP